MFSYSFYAVSGSLGGDAWVRFLGRRFSHVVAVAQHGLERRWMSKAVVPRMRPDAGKSAAGQAVDGKAIQGQPFAVPRLEAEDLGSNPGSCVFPMKNPSLQVDGLNDKLKIEERICGGVAK